MNGACSICLEPVEAEENAHARCVQHLFGTTRMPAVDVDRGKLHTLGLAMAGRTSISGIQKKVSLGLTSDRMTLRLALEGGMYILKPSSEHFPNMPENELLTMRVAEAAGVEVAACGLVTLVDGSRGYVTARFDRTRQGRKRRQEDFCQLGLKAPKEKYEGSAELCVRLLRKYSAEAPIELLRWFRLAVVVWWTGNGDMHLKNFSLVADDDGRFKLSPAYDLVCTRLYIGDDPLALPVGGKRDQLTARSWVDLARYCGLPPKAARRVVAEVVSAGPRAEKLISRSGLPEDMQRAYRALIETRARVLTEAADKLVSR
jgi:serine/threonine-protein kinase HipA